MGEQERIQAWVNAIEKLKIRAIEVAQEAQDKQWEYQEIMRKIADCERAMACQHGALYCLAADSRTHYERGVS